MNTAQMRQITMDAAPSPTRSPAQEAHGPGSWTRVVVVGLFHSSRCTEPMIDGATSPKLPDFTCEIEVSDLLASRVRPALFHPAGRRNLCIQATNRPSDLSS